MTLTDHARRSKTSDETSEKSTGLVPEARASKRSSLGTGRSNSKSIALAGRVVLFGAASAFLGCTWVSLTYEAREVRVLHAADVAECEKLGKTAATTADRVVFFARSERKVNEELETLARNEAARMGGDAVVPTDTEKEGRRSFDVYRCGLASEEAT